MEVGSDCATSTGAPLSRNKRIVEIGGSFMFSVNYGTTVRLTTLIVGLLLLGMVIYGVAKYRNGLPFLIGMVVFPLCTLVTCALFTVQAYEIKDGALYVVRPIGTLLVTDNVQSAQSDDEAMDGATRTWGNGGLFSISGWFNLPRYGKARLWVTDTSKLVVVKGPEVTAVVSPSRRDEFLQALGGRTSR
jgi:hypothetical protein